MNEYSQQIKRELEGFQSAIQKLGTGIKAASSLWKDPKYSGLSSEMTQIANLSKMYWYLVIRAVKLLINFSKQQTNNISFL